MEHIKFENALVVCLSGIKCTQLEFRNVAETFSNGSALNCTC
jgi:hypothetical protein